MSSTTNDALGDPATDLATDPAARAFVGIGSNLGDRLAHLRGAVAALRATPGVRVAAVSPVYESAAHCLAGQAPAPDYLNAVVALDTPLGPFALLRQLHAIEAGSGRTRETPWAPRTLDLDLLLVGDAEVETGDLTLPHPRLHLRRFVLAPLADVAPTLVVPGGGVPGRIMPGGGGATVAALLAACADAAPCVRMALQID